MAMSSWFTIQNGDFPLLCLFTRWYVHQPTWCCPHEVGLCMDLSERTPTNIFKRRGRSYSADQDGGLNMKLLRIGYDNGNASVGAAMINANIGIPWGKRGIKKITASSDMTYCDLGGKIFPSSHLPGERVSLCAKWSPWLNHSFDRRTLICESIARWLFPPSEFPEPWHPWPFRIWLWPCSTIKTW